MSGERAADEPDERSRGTNVIDHVLAHGCVGNAWQLETECWSVTTRRGHSGRVEAQLAWAGSGDGHGVAQDRVRGIVPITRCALFERQRDAQDAVPGRRATPLVEVGSIERRRQRRAEDELERPEQAPLAAVVFADQSGARVEAHGRGADGAHVLDVQVAKEHGCAIVRTGAELDWH